MEKLIQGDREALGAPPRGKGVGWWVGAMLVEPKFW